MSRIDEFKKAEANFIEVTAASFFFLKQDEKDESKIVIGMLKTMLDTIDDCKKKTAMCICGHMKYQHEEKYGCFNQTNPGENSEYRDREGFCICTGFVEEENE